MPRRRRSRINLRLLTILLVLFLVTGGGVFAVHRHQVAKSAEIARVAGFAALEDGDLPNAAAQLGHYCSFAPDDLDAREAYAQVLLDGWNEQKKAFELHEHILLKDPERDGLRLRQVRLALDIDRTIDARSHLDVLLKKTPDDAELSFLRAHCDELESHPEAAAAGYRKTIQLDPLHTRAHEQLAWLLDDSRLSKEADVVIEHLESGGRRDIDTLRVLAEFRAHRRDFEAAELLARAAVEQQPEDVRLLAKLAPVAEQFADVLARRGDGVEAKRVLDGWRGFIEGGIESQPDSPAFYIILAHLQQSAGDHDGAIATLRRGHKRIPDSDELPFLIVQQFILTDRTDQAQAELKRFPDTAGGRTYRQTLAGLIAMHGQRFQTARMTLQRVVDEGLDDNPFAENVRVQLARSCEALDEWHDAASVYEDILRRNPGNETARLGLAVALLASGLHREGVAELKSLSHLEGVLRHFVMLETEHTARQPEQIRDWTPLQEVLDEQSDGVDPREAAWLRALVAVAQRDLDAATAHLKSQHLERTETLFDLALVVYSNGIVPVELVEKIVEADPEDAQAASAVLAAWAQEDFQRVTGYVKDRLGTLQRKERLSRQAEVASVCATAGELIELAAPEAARQLFAQAEALLRQLAEIDAAGKPVLVDFLVARGRSQEAAEICESAFGRGSAEIAVVWLDAAQTHPDRDAELAKLEDVLQTAIEPTAVPSFDRSPYELQLVLGDLFAVTERYAEAETTYRRVLRAVPEHPLVQNNLAWLLAMQSRRLPEALELIEAAIVTAGMAPQLLDTRGCVRLALGENEEAEADFEMAVELEPSPDAYFHLAVVRQRLNDLEGARRAMRSAEEQGFRPELVLPLEKALVREVLDVR